jgi:hypothetical protein
MPLGLAEHRPVLSNRRRAYAFWELAARGAAPVAVVNWWTTFPAEALPGLVVAHGAYQLLEEGADGAVEPKEREIWLRELAEEVVDAASHEEPLVGLPMEARREVLARALLPDDFYRAALMDALAESEVGAAALYLPAPDIAADGWTWGEIPFGDLVRRELQATDGLLAGLLASSPDGFGTVVVVVDPGRRPGDGEGRVLLWRREGCQGPSGPAGVRPEQVASLLLRAQGFPQSAELPSPPALCPWPDPPSTLATYGERRQAAVEPGEVAEYLESLKSLGYL